MVPLCWSFQSYQFRIIFAIYVLVFSTTHLVPLSVSLKTCIQIRSSYFVLLIFIFWHCGRGTTCMEMPSCLGHHSTETSLEQWETRSQLCCKLELQYIISIYCNTDSHNISIHPITVAIDWRSWNITHWLI